MDYEQLLYLEQEVSARIGSWQPATGRRKTLDLFETIIVTLIYLRHNTIQAAVGEQARVSQATVSRYIETLEPVVSCCLDCLVLDQQRRGSRGDLVVDGFLIPTRDLTEAKGLFSGKRGAPGLNAQVVCDLHGRPVDADALLPGSAHDARAFRESGLAKAYEQHLTGNGPSTIGDCGYIGVVPLTPYKKPEYRELTPAELLYNRQVAPAARHIADTTHIRYGFYLLGAVCAVATVATAVPLRGKVSEADVDRPQLAARSRQRA